MGITYNKQTTKKDRLIMTHGPADRQRKQKMDQSGSDVSVISELRNQILELQKQLSQKAPTSVDTSELFTADQVNAEIIKAIKEETGVLKAKYKKEISDIRENLKNVSSDLVQAETKNKLLEKDIEVLKEKLADKEKTISELKTAKPEIDNNVTALLEEASKKIDNLTLKMASVSEGDLETSVFGNRPKMETVFVDPIEKEAKVEGTIEIIEDVSISKKEDMDSKVNKLRNLLGKLPSKK